MTVDTRAEPVGDIVISPAEELQPRFCAGLEDEPGSLSNFTIKRNIRSATRPAYRITPKRDEKSLRGWSSAFKIFIITANFQAPTMTVALPVISNISYI